MRILPYSDPTGVTEGVLVTFVDVTEIVAAEAQQRTLVEELNHRVRNMLAVVGAIANQTLARSESPQRFVQAFLGRIQAMGKAYTLVSREQWSEVALRDIVNSELGSYADESGGRIELRGPDVAFAPSRRSRSGWCSTSWPPTRSSTARSRAPRAM
jgi:two-component system, chemotaxis family, CheB/CheR fusion protein